MIGESALGGPGGAGLGSSRAVPELLWANLKLGVGLPGLSQWPEGGRTARAGRLGARVIGESARAGARRVAGGVARAYCRANLSREWVGWVRGTDKKGGRGQGRAGLELDCHRVGPQKARRGRSLS